MAWETHPNRLFHIQPLHRGETYLPMETEVFFEESAVRIAGCAIPVFSLRSEGSYGVGDFGDLKTFVRWAAAIPVFSLRSEGSYGVGDFGDLKTFVRWAADTGLRAVQILPINDTTMSGHWTDSYPYNSISIYAFHPMYIDLRQLPPLTDKEASDRFEEERIILNQLPEVDYEEVNRLKRAYLRAGYLQEGEKVLQSEAFHAYFERNSHWLLPYAAFSVLRDRYGTPDFRQWEIYSEYDAEAIASLGSPESSSYREIGFYYYLQYCLHVQLLTPDFRQWEIYSEYDAEAIASLGSPESSSYREIGFYYYLQYCLHVQLLSAAAYARSRGVILKGDIPIGISRSSVESWVEPYYFNLNGQAGAPPDAFSTKGQNWGFPTYNWEVMEQDHYLWWRRRFAQMAEYFTAYRIDHILGFFRIWEIPDHSVHGLLGQFVPSLPMSVDEIRSFGLNFRADQMLRPFISEYMLNTLFGEQSDYVRETFVRPLHHDLYEMRPEFDTQRKVEAWFAGKTDEESLKLKESLYELISDVLFVPDRKQPDRYHPRIAVQNDYVFKQLTPQEQEAFNQLYNHYYYQRHNEFWYREAMKKLPELTQSTSMLVCGEDLGMVPDCVPWVMNELQILSLEIQRMPKAMGQLFGRVEAYPYHSVCTIGTHDMSTFRGWWEEDPQLTERFYHDELHHWGEVPEQAPGWLCKEVIKQHLDSPSMLCILTWQDWLSVDEALRNPDVEAERGRVEAYPYHSVCTIGTHDMSTFRGWWEEDPQLTERFYHDELHHWGEVPEQAPGWLCKEVIKQHLDSPSMLCILTWQDWLSVDEVLRNPDVEAERINVPANPLNYWHWRMHLTLEQLMEADELNETIRELAVR